MCCSSLVSSGTCSWAKRKKKARKSPRSRGAARRVPRPFYSFPHCLSRAWRDRVVKAVSLGILRCFQAHIALLLRCSWSPGTDHFFFLSQTRSPLPDGSTPSPFPPPEPSAVQPSTKFSSSQSAMSSYYEAQGWQAPASRQVSWEQPVPPSRSGMDLWTRSGT